MTLWCTGHLQKYRHEAQYTYCYSVDKGGKGWRQLHTLAAIDEADVIGGIRVLLDKSQRPVSGLIHILTLTFTS